LALLESGRDLRPDTITPSPDITFLRRSKAFRHIEENVAEVLAEDDEFASEASADEAETTAPAVTEEAASGGSPDDEKQ
jgi:hypothetical protein